MKTSVFESVGGETRVPLKESRERLECLWNRVLVETNVSVRVSLREWSVYESVLGETRLFVKVSLGRLECLWECLWETMSACQSVFGETKLWKCLGGGLSICESVFGRLWVLVESVLGRLWCVYESVLRETRVSVKVSRERLDCLWECLGGGFSVRESVCGRLGVLVGVQKNRVLWESLWRLHCVCQSV